MAASGYTPISLYYSTTASTAPTAGNLTNGELAINITDGKLYYKDNAGVVQLIATKTAAAGGVTSVTGTSPVASSGGTTPAISLSSGYGDTQNPYASKTANYFLAAPNGSSGAPTFRAMVAADVPTLNQNTTGSAGSVVNALTAGTGITGTASTFNGSAAVTFNATGSTLNSQSTSYTLVAADAGKSVSTTAGVTVNNSVFSAGNIVTIFNNSGSNITITQGTGVTMYWSGNSGSSGNRTLAQRSICTILFISASVCTISGSGLS